MPHREEINRCSRRIVDAAMRVHTELGPGLLESAYHACLAYELRERGSMVAMQVPVPIVYAGVQLEVGYRIDLLVDDSVVVELKTVIRLLPIHKAQLISYLKLSGHRLGLLINFQSVHLKDGITRMVNNW